MSPDSLKPRKPKLTDRVLRGIIEVTSVAMAGSPADMFGYDGPEERKRFDDVAAADQWARGMREYREAPHA